MLDDELLWCPICGEAVEPVTDCAVTVPSEYWGMVAHTTERELVCSVCGEPVEELPWWYGLYDSEEEMRDYNGVPA